MCNRFSVCYIEEIVIYLVCTYVSSSYLIIPPFYFDIKSDILPPIIRIRRHNSRRTWKTTVSSASKLLGKCSRLF